LFNETGDFDEKNKTVFDAFQAVALVQRNDVAGQQSQGLIMKPFRPSFLWVWRSWNHRKMPIRIYIAVFDWIDWNFKRSVK